MIDGPAYRIETDRLVLRCFEPSDTEALKALIDANVDHLRPWMGWARDEPTPYETKLALVRRFRADFDLGKSLTYGVFTRTADGHEARLVGGSALQHHSYVEGVEGFEWAEIGYWLARDCTGSGLATEAAGALARVAFDTEHVKRVEIHCDADNVPSARVAERLGFVLDATLRRRRTRPDGTISASLVWSLFADELARSPAAKLRLQAFDAVGRTLLDARTERPPSRGSAFR